MGKGRRKSLQFKEQAIALARGSDKPLGEVAASLGVHESTLRYWVDNPPKRPAWASTRAGTPADEPVSDDPVALKLQLNEARAVIARLEMEKEILKKATAFFAREHP